jgi:hypothetical protein
MASVLIGVYVLAILIAALGLINVLSSRTEWRVSPNVPPGESGDMYFTQVRDVGRLWAVSNWHSVGSSMPYQLACDVVDNLNKKERDRA